MQVSGPFHSQATPANPLTEYQWSIPQKSVWNRLHISLKLSPIMP